MDIPCVFRSYPDRFAHTIGKEMTKMNELFSAIARPSFLPVLWLFFVVFVLHELEEWNIDQFERRYFIGLPSDATDRSARMWIAFVVLLGLVWTAAATLPGSPATAAWIFLPALAIMIQNAIQHIFWTVYFRRYAPGVVTAALLLIPLGLYGMAQAVLQGLVPFWYAGIWAALIVAGSIQTIAAGNKMTPLIRAINVLGIRLAQMGGAK